MKHIIYFCILIFFIFILYLAYCTSKEGYTNHNNKGSRIPGISSICIPSIASYNDPSICFDISYVDSVSNNVLQVKAKIKPGYFINKSGFLEVVPYGYVVSSDKRSYVTKTKTAAFEEASNANANDIIDEKIKSIQKLLDSTKDAQQIQGYKQEIENLEHKKIYNMNENKTSNKMYNSDNLGITYHTDPTQEISPDSNNLSVGQMWIKDTNGKLKVVSYKDELNTTHYYPAGSYVFNPPSYVPNYEESVFLSKMTNLPTVTELDKDVKNKLFPDTNALIIDKETKCNALDHTSCKNSKYCVLFGGVKCVAGDDTGPELKSNYSDITIINRDYYYYKTKCYGNCP